MYEKGGAALLPENIKKEKAESERWQVLTFPKGGGGGKKGGVRPDGYYHVKRRSRPGVGVFTLRSSSRSGKQARRKEGGEGGGGESA